MQTSYEGVVRRDTEERRKKNDIYLWIHYLTPLQVSNVFPVVIFEIVVLYFQILLISLFFKSNSNEKNVI